MPNEALFNIQSYYDIIIQQLPFGIKYYVRTMYIIPFMRLNRDFILATFLLQEMI